MSSIPAIVIIDSSDEDDEVVFIGETCSSATLPDHTSCSLVKTEASNSDKENDSKDHSVVKKETPIMKINQAKLDSLKRKVNVLKGNENTFKINQTRLKRLRAVVKLNLSTSTQSPVKVNEKKMDTSDDLECEKNRPLLQSPDHQFQQDKISDISPFNGHQSSLNHSTVLPDSHYNGFNESVQKIDALRKLTQSPIKSYCVSHDQKSPKKSLLHLQKDSKYFKPLFGGTSKSVNETPVVTMNREVIWPPSHVILDKTMFFRKLFTEPKLYSVYFCNTIEYLQDAEFFYDVVKTIQGLMTSNIAPPAELVWSLVKDILLKSDNKRLSLLTYSVLNEIHTRFPAICLAMKIDWNQVQTVTRTLFSSASSGTQLQFLNANLALLFLLAALASEFKSVALKSKPTRVTILFSPDYDMRKVKVIVASLRGCLCNHKDGCLPGNVASHSSVDTAGTSVPDNTICSVEFFQILLKFVMVSSANKEDVSFRIADELLYLYVDLTTLQARVLLLRTIQSHVIRKQLITVLLMNYCSLRPEALQDNGMLVNATRILLQDFYRFPPRRSSSYSDDYWTKEEIEEYVMLVAYLLQSYIVMHSTLQSYHSDFLSFKHEQVKQFTDKDTTALKDLSFHTSALRESCQGFLANTETLSVRTCLMLEMMELLEL